MRCDAKGLKVKAYFGDFLEESRRAMDMSVYDVSYVLGTSYSTIWCWEKGLSFPKSIVLLKKLALVYRDVPDMLKNIVAMSGIAPSKLEWVRFEKEVFSGEGRIENKVSPVYVSRDQRDVDYKLAFGEYLRREREERGIPYLAMANALKVRPTPYRLWEAGSAFPQDVMVLAYLDKLYGNLFDVLFGLCEDGIHLSPSEKGLVLYRLGEFENTGLWDEGKSKPPAWERFKKVHSKRMRRRKEEMVIPDISLRGLEILNRFGEVTKRAFARAMWPKNEVWLKKATVSNGQGIAAGPAKMDAGAMGMLYGMEKRGWIKESEGKYGLLVKGKKTMLMAKEARKKR